MPDCSAVTITNRGAVVRPEHTPALEARLEQLAKDFGVPVFDCSKEDDGTLTFSFEDYDAPWGNTNDDLTNVRATLRELELAYFSIDHGHYTWDADMIGWRPGMGDNADDETVRSVGIEGGPTYLRDGQWRALKKRIEADQSECDAAFAMIAAIDAHFGDDPEGWL